MAVVAYLDLLAQLPQGEVYFNPLKLVGLVAVFVIWTLYAQWVDKDTIAVNTYRELWNLVVMAGGTAGLFVGFLVTNFLIGFLVMIGLVLGVMIAYVLHRNGLVNPEDTVCTMAHIRRMQAEGLFGKKKKQVKEVKERVRLTGANRKVVPIPEEEEEREQYRLTQDLVFDLLWQRATLVNVTPAGQGTKITYEIDGITKEREPLTRPEGDATIAFLKGITNLNPEERRKPQRGRILAAIGENRYDLVVETAGSTAGETLRVRVLGLENTGKTENLGFTEKQLAALPAVMQREKGVVLLSAPRGAGLTTTVYSFVRTHDAFLQNIQMLEYDHEIDVNNVTQKAFAPEGERTFTEEVQRMVRSDPDILVFPEVREREAAAVICKGGGEKIRMYVGLVAEDVFDALRKWIALVGDKGAVAKALWMVTSQRLVRRLCGECKQPYKPEAAMLKKLNMPADTVLHRQPAPEYDKHGNPIICQACQGTGYVGRVGVFDVLMVDAELREVIRSASSLSEVQTFAMKRGGLGIQTQALQKVLDGTTSIQEVVRVIRGQKQPSPEAKPQPRPKAKA
ncbi:MAG: ATPase, T2SS/T4P/T4SS family [Phycisphaerae bacterium]|jgi:type II secretory ATPase GspE/PulE/Tfp pilus assembly ATPase PilB-like protein